MISPDLKHRTYPDPRLDSRRRAVPTPFGRILRSVLDSTINTMQSMQSDADTSVQKFLTGENEELHTTVLATQRAAEMAFELGLQVRNKVVSAYQEIMKMQL